MDDQSRPADSHDPRIDTALHEYLERLDRGERLDPQSFVAQHTEIADELRSVIEAEVELRELASGDAQGSRADASTRSFALQGQETIAPQSQWKQADGSAKGGLQGQFGRYRIVKVLGQGAMGTVYLAEDTQLKRQVALKTPHFDADPSGELLERLYREARAAATLRHPNICPVHDVGEIDGTHYISMAYIEGHPLSAFVRSSKPQPERQTLIVVRKLAQALQEAHEHKIVHRDLKPANIMVDKRGEPLIMDFGLARHTRPDDDARLTHSGTLVGTPAYMAPEQVDADPAKIGPLTDEYSLGVILYELITGQLPFRGSMMAVLGQIVTKEPTPPSQLRPALDPRIEAACLKMMAKNPSDRFPSLTAVADELASILKNPGARPVSSAKSAASLTLPAAADARASSSAGSSKILKSQTLKTLTGSDLESLEELARKCWSRHDYDQVIQIAERIPEEKRSPGLQTLLEKARSRADEISFLVVEIDEAVRLSDRQAALKKADALLKIKPGHLRGLEVQEQFSGYGDGGAVRIGPKSLAQTWRDGGWIPWSALAFGLAIVGVVAGVIVIWMGKTVLVIDAKDPGIEVSVKGAQVVITAPGEQTIRVEPGNHELKVSYAGLQTVTKSFTLKRGQTQRLRVQILDDKLLAQLQGETLPLIAETEKAKGVGQAAAETKGPAPVPSAAIASVAKAPTEGVGFPANSVSRDGFVSLFNGKDLTGWKKDPDRPEGWHVYEGVLSGGPAGEASVLYSERDNYKNFRLRVEAKLKDNQSSELWVRTQIPSTNSSNRIPTAGFEVDLKEPAGREPRTGSIWSVTLTPEGRRRVNGYGRMDSMVRPDEWFTLEVVAEGEHVYAVVNGEVAHDTHWSRRDQHESGRIAIEQHAGQPSVEFRSIEIKELPFDIPADPIKGSASLPTAATSRTPQDKNALIAPFDESEAKTAQQQWSSRLKLPVELQNTVGMRLQLIPPGQFIMGSDHWASHVAPAHSVRITRPYYLGTFEVTRGQFAKFVTATHFKTRAEQKPGGWRLDNSDKKVVHESKKHYTWRKPGFAQDDRHPVVNVDYEDIRAFCEWISSKEGKKYRLPTEAEWEYACRAGTQGDYYLGNKSEDLPQIANFPDADAKSKFSGWTTNITGSDGYAYTSPVGQFRPNNFGLYDMLGNVMEWCSDWHDGDYYKNSPVDDPPGAASGKSRAARGGSFTVKAEASSRWYKVPDHRFPDCGFRVVCEIPLAPGAADVALAGAKSSASGPQSASFFNGRNLDGWQGLSDFWHVKNRAIVGTVPIGKRAHTFLCSNREYKDFELKFRARLLGGVGNSGVQFRSKIKDPVKFTVVGPQCEICGLGRARPYAPGSLVSEPHGTPDVPAAADQVARIYREADFNDFEIRCVGQHVRIKLNGQTTVDADFPAMPDEGLIGWQMHGNDPPREVTFKDIEFRDLSGGKMPVGGL